MKKTVVFLAAAVVLATGISFGYAQAGNQPAMKAGNQPRGAQMGPMMGQGQRRGPGLSEQLNLTEDQRAKVKSIMEKQMAKIQEIQNETDKQIDAILTPQQKTKLDQIRKEAQARMQAQMQKSMQQRSKPAAK